MNGIAEFRNGFDASPDAALVTVREFPGTLLLDFDETLYLRNSTEDFLDTAAPGLVALILLRVLDVIKPWRFTGGLDTRDVWRVRLVSLCLPWIWLRWRRRVRALASAHRNAALIDALRMRSGPTVITTLAFIPVVRPLLVALGVADADLIATRLNTIADRRLGKAGLCLAKLGAERIATSAVLTDSLDDQPLLERCAVPLRTVWPGAQYRHALGRVYLPGQYLTRVKRPGQRYVLRGILQEDFAFWVLCSIAFASSPLLHVAGLLLLLLSFWAIYERGYVDNDWVAVRYEREPKLSEAYGSVDVATPALQPWIWAVTAGLAGIAVLRWPGTMTLTDVARWGAVLVLTHAGFWIYNRLDKSSRIWLFPALQFARSASFVVLVPVGLAASAALGAHVLARWVPYYLYRIGGKDWPEAPFFLSRLMFYIVLWLALALTQDSTHLVTWTALALLLWNLYRACKELLTMLRAMHRIDRQGPAGSPPSAP